VQLRARYVPRLLGVLAVAIEVVGFAAFLASFSFIAVEVSDWSWLWLPWAAGAVAALVALILGLVFDRRGMTLPLALLALLLAAMPMGALVYLLSWEG
jgi:ABC-type Fe3+-siderophore transport system permease subunit